MTLGAPKETHAGERRVALTPDVAGRLAQAGIEVFIERGAGAEAYFPDEAYAAAGARLVGAGEAFGADLVVKVQPPTEGEIAALRRGAALISFLRPAWNRELMEKLAAGGVTALALELVPRSTRAQTMDALSSQATVAGYKAVLLGGERLGRMMPLLMTAAGTLVPAKVLVLGAGVAGLQAIATARRLGAVVTGFDVRAAVAEQVRSLGANFLEMPAAAGAGGSGEGSAEGVGGYAKELAADQQRRVRETVAAAAKEMDLVITTAQIPGRPAPMLLDAAAVAAMRPGAVIVDLAAETGGNCELTRPDEEVIVGAARILGPTNLAATVPQHASQMLAKNIQAVLRHLVPERELRLDLTDEITAAMTAVHAGGVRYGQVAADGPSGPRAKSAATLAAAQ